MWKILSNTAQFTSFYQENLLIFVDEENNFILPYPIVKQIL
jgi:hypothetical protein